MDNNILYLEVADFIIKFAFYPSSFKGVQKKFIKNILKIYEGFLITDIKDKKIDFTINIQDVTEMKLLIRNKKNIISKYLYLYERKNNCINTYYYVNLLQLRHILREVLQILLTKNQGLQLHASASIVNNSVVLFVGAHGAGKSTAIKLAKKSFPIFADDSVAVRFIDGKFYAYNTFEFEKNLTRKFYKRYPIKSINFLYKSQQTYLKEINIKNIATQLLLKESWFMDASSFKNQSSTILKIINSDIIFNKLFFSRNVNKFMQMLQQN